MADDTGTLSDDEVNQIGFADDSGNAAPTPPSAPDQGVLSDDEVNQIGFADNQPSSSPIGAAARQFVRGIVPNAAAAIAGDVAGGVGLSVAGPIGGAAAAVAAAVPTAYAADAAQQKMLDSLGASDSEALGGVLSTNQQQADVQQHPYWSEFGNLAAAAVTLNIGGLEAALSRRAIGGGIMAGINIGQQEYDTGKIDPTQTALAAAGGAAFAGEMRPWARGVTDRLIPGRLTRQSQVDTGKVTGRPNVQDTPTAAADRQESEEANDVTAVAIGATNDNVAETHTPDTVQAAPAAATLETVRSDTDYKKGGAPTAGGIQGAPSTIMATGDSPAADITAALQAAQPEQEGIGLGNQQQVFRGDQPEPAAAPKQINDVAPAQPTAAPEPPPDLTGLQQPDRRVQNLVRQDIERRRQPQQIGNGTQGQAFQPLPPKIENAPSAQPGLKPVVVQGSRMLLPPHLADVVAVPDITNALKETPPTEGLPTKAVISGGTFDPATALHVNGVVNEGVKGALTRGGMDTDAAEKIAQSDFAKPTEDAYIQGLGLDPAQADRWWAKQGREPFEGMPTPEEQAQANQILTGKEVKAPESHVQESAENGVISTQKPRALELALQRLRDRGDEDAAGKLAAMEDPAAQAAAAAKINKQHTNAAGRPSIDGVQLRGSKDEMARKQSADKAYKSAYDQFKPEADEDDEDLVKRVTAAVTAAKEAHGGKNPVDKTEGYAPREKPPAWQFIKRGQQLIKDPSDENISAFRADEAQGWSKDVAQTARIKADIELNKRTPGDEAATQPSPDNAAVNTRVTFPDVDTSKGDALSEDRQALHDYINNLPDAEYQRLSEIYQTDEHPFEQVVDTSSDPHKLQLQMESDMDTTGLKAPGFEAVPAEEAPVVKMERVAGAPAKASEGAASEGKSRKDLLAEYNAKLKAGELGGKTTTPEERAQENINHDNRVLDTESITGQWGPVRKKAAEMLKDESGSLNIQKVAPWLFGGKADPFSPEADSTVKAIPEQISDWFHDYTNKGINTDQKLAAMNAAAPDLTPKEWDQIGRAKEDRTLASLPQKLQDAYVSSQRPLELWQNDLVDQIRDEFPHLLEKPFTGVTKDFVPRLRVNELQNPTPQADITVYKRNLSTFRGAAQARDYFTLDDGNGQRLVMSPPGDDGKMTIFRNGAPNTVKVPAGFEGKLGQTVDLNVKGKPYKFTVDHSTVPELEKNIQNLKFVHNPFFTTANSVRQLSSMLDTARLLETLKTDPTVASLRSTADKDTRPANYRKTTLEEMNTYNGKQAYYDPKIANIFDDFVKPGFGQEDQLQKVRNVVRGLSNTLYFFGAPIHALNEANLWATARGFDWLKPTEYYHMVTEGLDSMKSVYTQDGFNDDIRRVGGNPMLASVLLRDGVLNQIGQKMGVYITKNPSVFDPITKASGIDTPALAASALKQSNTGMWYANDVLLQSLVRRNLRQNPNSTLRQAVDQAHEFISDYREKYGTVAGSRLFQQFLLDPSTSWFGRYHLGLFRSLGNMTGNLLAGETPQKRIDALGQIMVLGALTWGLSPLLDKGAQYLTGNPNAKVNPRGLSTILKSAQAVAQDPSQIGKLAGQVWTPSIPMRALAEAPGNRELFTGKNIIPPGTSYPRAAVKALDYGIRTAIPPYDLASRQVTKPGAGIGTAARGFLENSVGISEPTYKSTRFQNQGGKHAVQAEKTGRKQPGGLGEELYNALTR